MSENLFWIYVTAKDCDEARRIGRAIVEERLAACANIVERIESFYWWKGALQHDTEALLIAKTKQSQLSGLIDRVKRLHSYECPCIEILPIAGGNPDYLRWIEEESGPRPQ